MSQITLKQDVELKKLLRTPKTGFHSIGGCVDFMYLNVAPDPIKSSYEIHKEVALFAINHISGNIGKLVPKLMKGDKCENVEVFQKSFPLFASGFASAQ